MIEMPSPNFDARGDVAPSYLILHYTGMQTAQAALDRLCDTDSKVSAHYTIDEDGTIYRLVDEDKRAWHAGVSYWKGITDMNAHSIGIELVNPGHEFGYRSFSDTQMKVCAGLCRDIIERHKIVPTNVLAHSDIAPMRKEDPGELFPWKNLAMQGIGIWPGENGEALGDMHDALIAYGYDPEASLDAVITAFQRHFVPEVFEGQGTPGIACALTQSRLQSLLAL